MVVMNEIKFIHDRNVIEAEYHTSLRHSYLTVFLNGAQISETEMFSHSPEYETYEGLNAAAIKAYEHFKQAQAELE